MQTFGLTGRRLGNAALLYLALTITVITLAPFQFELRPVHGLTTQWGSFDLVMNVVMFVPVGFIYALSRWHARSRRARSISARRIDGWSAPATFSVMRSWRSNTSSSVPSSRSVQTLAPLVTSISCTVMRTRPPAFCTLPWS